MDKQFWERLEKGKKNYIVNLRTHIKHKINAKNNTKKIWIINDKHNLAGGNGEYFYRFLKRKKPKNLNFYFVIQRNCSDFKRIKKIGGILDLYSFRYKYIILQADKMISSESDTLIENPFNNDHIYIRDLIKFDKIYINNEIIKDDLSNYYNKFDKNINLFITSLKREYNSILKYKYGYKKDNVVLLGSPYFDNIKKFRNKDNNNKKKL